MSKILKNLFNVLAQVAIEKSDKQNTTNKMIVQ